MVNVKVASVMRVNNRRRDRRNAVLDGFDNVQKRPLVHTVVGIASEARLFRTDDPRRGACRLHPSGDSRAHVCGTLSLGTRRFAVRENENMHVIPARDVAR
jgi:hypothetical protein